MKRKLISLFQLDLVIERIIALLKTPIFWLLTVCGNAFILAGAMLFQNFESPINPAAEKFVDCLAWAVGIVTTVGAGGIQPHTYPGKILLILMMVGGAVFLWSYMTLFIGALIGPELRTIEKEMSEIQEATLQEDKILEQIRTLVERAERSNLERHRK